ncbi:metallophosphoesterase family protein, partial [bacterium]
RRERPASFGDIVYNGRAGICFGDWWEGPRSFRLKGMIAQAALFDRALTPGEVDAALAETSTQPMPTPAEGEPKTVIAPYFQYPTAHSATVMWETSVAAPTRVRYGESRATAQEAEGEPGRIHRLELKDLKPSTTYFVQTLAPEGEWSSFRTGSLPGTPVKFAIVGDTQDHPETNHRIAAGMFSARPDFAVIVGDLVGEGWKKEQWVNDFFASMRPLLSHVPLLPVLGNHDRNARIYYDLMSLPDPEYFYSYRSGDVEFWSVDTDHDVSPGSVQYRWLEDGLRRSKARWKIVAHHYPPYSSDVDDYGDANSGPIRGGDLQARRLSALYDKYGVDLCFSGHIHSYERTYPMRNGRVAPDGKGTVYLVVGG